MRATGQFTITDMNDAVYGGTAPANPTVGMLWMDTSQTPPVLKTYTGSTDGWKEANGTDDLRSNKADAEGGENAAGKFGWSITPNGLVLYSNGTEVMRVTKNGMATFRGSVDAQNFIGAERGSFPETETERVIFSESGEIKGLDVSYKVITFTAAVQKTGARIRVSVDASEAVPISTTINVTYVIRDSGDDYSYNVNLTIPAGAASTNTLVSASQDAEPIFASATPNQKIYYDSTGQAPRIGITVHFVPATDGDLSCGSSGNRWNDIYSVNSHIQSSDRDMKKDIAPLDPRYGKLFDLLAPVQYKFIDGTSGRTHTGLIAQDVEDAMTAVGLSGADFAGLIKSENGYGLRYGEFIALCISEIQKLKARVAELEETK